MISVSYPVAVFAALVALWIGAMIGIFTAALCTSARGCTCKGERDA